VLFVRWVSKAHAASERDKKVGVTRESARFDRDPGCLSVQKRPDLRAPACIAWSTIHPATLATLAREW
jgi:hypothetical protein